ncbi:MAG: 3'-5' exonuclease, partial [Nitratireductor sp.]
QGADPQEFDKQRKALQTRTKNIDEETKNISLSLSFRSTEEVLNAVDTVFSLPENAKGLIQDGNVSSHTANRASDIGEVSIWPLIEKPEKIKKTEWLDPYDKLQEENAEVVLAKRISKQIKQWLDRREKLPGREEKISAGDILILVRKRDLFASAITRELKRANLPTAGADRLKLTEHILVEDMMALGRFAMMQIDDLALAGLLKSPLFDLSEEELFELANLRGAATLHDAIYSNSDKYSAALLSKLEPIKTNISQILQDARNKPAFEFYADLFATHDLRKRYLQQMGSEAEEVIDGFLQAALNHDIKSASGIIDFIEWLSNAEPEIKREIDLEANEIRVITVHSSKGLEKPIVFLVDPGSKVFDTGKHMPKIASLKDNKGNNAFIWQPKTENHIEETQAFRDKVEQDAEDEYRRLLYVGMTRAADKLIVCGYGKNDAPHNHWHKMVKRGLVDGNSGRANGKLIDEIQNEEIVAQHWKIENPLHKERAQKEKPVVEPATAHKAQWLFEAAKPEYLAPKPLTPSGVLGLSQIDDEKDRSQDVGSKNALNKGNAIHRLLQIVPDIEPQKRDALFESFFKNHQIDFTSTNEKEIRSSVEQIMNDENLSELFGANSRAEISISGEVTLADGKTHLVNGQIDRLVIGEGIVKIFDYKTNYQVPKNPYEVSSNYVAQMALYRELIKQIYDQKKVVCSIIWTQTGELMCLTDDILDKQLAQLTNT